MISWATRLLARGCVRPIPVNVAEIGFVCLRKPAERRVSFLLDAMLGLVRGNHAGWGWLPGPVKTPYVLS